MESVNFVASEMADDGSYGYYLKSLEDPRLIIDVGGNIGLFAIGACLRFPKAKILVFEPHPFNFRFLVDNVKRAGCGGRVLALNRGLSHHGQTVELGLVGITVRVSNVDRGGFARSRLAH